MRAGDILPLLGDLKVEVMTVEECDSTNTQLKRMEPTLPGDTVLIAGRQSAGRGRLGRGFYSPDGSGLYMSVLVRPRLSPADATLLTPAAAVAVCGAVEELTGVRAEIKWVNDVYVRGKKVCGILSESVLGPGGELRCCVVGIGVNLSPPPGGFPPDISGLAGAVLREYAPRKLPALAAGIITRFFRILPAVTELGFVEEYRRRSMLTGRDVWVIRGDEKLPAHVTGITGRCGLMVEYPGGGTEVLSSGEVTIRPR